MSLNSDLLCFPIHRVLQDHTTSSGVQNQALDSLKLKLNETEENLRRQQEANSHMQVKIKDRKDWQ